MVWRLGDRIGGVTAMEETFNLVRDGDSLGGLSPAAEAAA
jgi:hypothetical protein